MVVIMRTRSWELEIVLALMEKLIAGYGANEAGHEMAGYFRNLFGACPKCRWAQHRGHRVTIRAGRKNVRDVNGDGITGIYPEGRGCESWLQFLIGRWLAPTIRRAPATEGPYPFSQAENRAMRALADKRQLLLSVSYHSQGEVIYYPWVWGKK